MGKDNKKLDNAVKMSEYSDELEYVEEKPAEVAAPEPLVSFEAWFMSTQRPTHHKAGMRAYTKTSNKRTVSNWNTLFANY